MQEELLEIFNRAKENSKIDSIVDWAERKRVLDSSVSAKYGRVSFDYSPYLREILERFSITDPTKEVVLMKGAQIGASQMILENIIGYTIDVYPRSMLYLSADQRLVEDAIETRLDGMLASCNVSHKLKPVSNKANNRSTGDTKRKKEFNGGILYSAGGASPNKYRSISVPIVLFDEIDGVKRSLKGNGSPAELAKSRTIAFENVKKILYLSTPTTIHESNIYPLFLEGDQRRWFVPCPHCNTFQVLTWDGREIFIDGAKGILRSEENKEKDCGLKFEKDPSGNLVDGSVFYKCVNGCKILETDKFEMNKKGEWRPTARSKSPHYVSYHLSSLPSNFSSWDEIASLFLSARRNNQDFQVWINNRLGEPWVEEFKNINISKIRSNQRDYKAGTVPNSIALHDGNTRIAVVVMAVDVNGAADLSHGWLAVEIKGYCGSGQSYSIAKAEIHGDTSHNGGCWAALHDIHRNARFMGDDGIEYKIQFTVVDSGNKTSEVYGFTNTYRNSYAVKGSGGFKSLYRFKLATGSKTVSNLYHLNVGTYKDELHSYLLQEYEEITAQPPNYLNFPINETYTGFESLNLEKYGVTLAGAGYNEKYFSTFNAEYKREEINPTTGEVSRSIWIKRHSESYNHFWDCNVYALAAVEIYCNILAEHKGAKDANRNSVLTSLANSTEKYRRQYGN